MKFVLEEINDDLERNKTKYVSLLDYAEKRDQKLNVKATINNCKQDIPNPRYNNIIKSKVLVIDNLTINISEDLNNNFTFKIDTECAVLSDRITIPKIDITAKESVMFDEDITLAKLESIIRRCGVLEEYSEYFSNDPDIIINSYSLNIHKEYKFFNEFKEGVLIGEEIFM